MGRASACLKLVRPVNSAMVGFAVIVGAVIAAGRLPPAPEAVSAFLVGFLVSASAMVINDIADVEIDRVNAPHRPIPSGAVPVGLAWACFAALSAAGVGLSATTGPATLAVAAAAWAIGVAYSVWGKRLGLPGNAMVAFSVAVPLLYGAALTGSFTGRILVYWYMVFATALAREIAKGIADVPGDRAAGVRTLAVVAGERRAALAAAALYASAVAVSPLPLILGLVERPHAYAALVAVVDAGLLADAVLLVARPTREAALAHKRRVLLYMLVGLVAFLAGGVS